MTMQVTALLWRATYVRYVAASAISLAVDLSLFVALQTSGMTISLVSAASYSAGIATHWLISSRFLFAADVRALSAERRRQQILFLMSALAGLALTTVIVTVAAQLGIDPRLAKLGAVGVSFQTTYLLRSKVVFA